MEILVFSIVFSMLFQLLGKYSNLYKTFLKRKNIPQALNSNLKISIIIPTYNEEVVIEKNIENIQKSSYKNFEIIVIDDNSEDNTFSILKRLEEKYDNLKILRKKSEKGKAQSLNEAIEHAEGHVILFLDADAIIDEDYLEKHIKYFYNSKINMIYTDFEPYNYRPQVIFDFQEIYFEFSKNMLYSNLFSKAVFMGTGVFIRSNILKKVLPFDSETLVDDVHLAIKLNQIGITQTFVVSPKTKIQYVNNYKDLFFQHVRWYKGGIEEFVKFIKKKNTKLLIFLLFIFILLIYPIISFILLFINLEISMLLFKYYINLFFGILIGTAFLLTNKYQNFLSFIRNIFITIPFMLLFEYCVLGYSFFSLLKKEKQWYKVQREKI